MAEHIIDKFEYDNNVYKLQDNVSGYITSSDIPSLLSGTTANTTPTQVATALANNRNVEISHTDSTYGSYKFYDFIYNTTNDVVIAGIIAQYNSTWMSFELSGWLFDDSWHTYVTTIPSTSDIPTKTSELTNDSGFITGYTETDPIFMASAAHTITASNITNWNNKQDALISGTNIKTINNTSILGSGNISIDASGEAIEISQADYNALTPAQKSDGTIYFIYDATPSPTPTPVGNLQNLVDGSATGSVRGIGTAAESGSYLMGNYAFAEGYNTKASGTLSHAEGTSTYADGDMSHAEGDSTVASGDGSHAEGIGTNASGNSSHAQNYGTIAQRKSQTALGEYNIADTTGTTSTRGDYSIIIGNGTADNARSNALTVDWSGNTVQQGTATTADMTSSEIDSFIGNLNISAPSTLIDFFYPVGSYYETSNALFDPNIAWSGTWILETEGQVHVSAGANYEVGDTGGEATHTLTVNEMPSHKHRLSYRTGVVAQGTSGMYYFDVGTAGTWYDSPSIEVSGGGQAHENMPPYIVVNRWHRTA